MIEKALLKLRLRDDLSAEEEGALRAAVSETMEVAADTVPVRSDEELTSCRILLEGLMCRYKDLRNGERQVTELHVSGDFVDLHSFTLKRLDHNIMALTPCRVALVPHQALEEISRDHPHLTRLLWFSTNLDASIHREWELSLGRRTALAKMAHLFCELYIRLEIVELARQFEYDLPLTQTDLSECLGLTPVHINRTLKELREQDLVTFRDRVVTIHDWERLQRVAEFNPSYLYLERRAR